LAQAARGAGPPAAALRLPAAALALGWFFMRFRTFSGLDAGTALLALTAGLKFLETRTSRDLYVLVLIALFLGLAALLASASPWSIPYLLGVAWLATTATLRIDATAGGQTPASSLAYALRVLVQALPIALALWLFFPRLATPLWRIGPPAGGAVSGLGDTMSPGDIGDLALSDEIAFRAHFNGRTPPHRELYWRGPVLDVFDGRVWRRRDRGFAATPVAAPGRDVYRYRLNLEPSPRHWLVALDRPRAADLPGTRLSDDGVLMRARAGALPIDLAVESDLGPPPPVALAQATLREDTALPAAGNPRTRAYALALRRAHPRDGELAAAVLAWFHRDAFYYTLTPPPLPGADSVDDFLFATRRGFCEHYASAFAVLMRAAGIPARVVTGYFGGKYNPYGGYWIIRQSDAHAWDEIWIRGRGWLRVDPTAAIAPQRVDPSLLDEASEDGAFSAGLGLRAPWTAGIALRFDAMRLWWREAVLHYDSGAQRSLLGAMRIPHPDSRKLAALLAAALGLALAWLTVSMRRELAPRPRAEPARSYARLGAKLAARGLARRPYEGPEDYGRRVAAARPDLGARVQALCREYAALRYGREPPPGRVRAFRAAVRAFKPPRSPASF
ncbi:MAG: DUF3488 domain-containing transglutaminase family protein, partial [Gammaproteobacteria bacterium]|nr:DUF3488 domain-containing transglutaminase family protein [Gammaproteobacteria bacterium]